MENMTREKKQSLSIQKKNRNAGFVPLESKDNEKFKYKVSLRLSRYINQMLARVRARFNKTVHATGLMVNIVDWKSITKEGIVWIVESAIEGVTANYAMHYLFNAPFNIATVFAYGIAIKQGLSVFWRLKTNGPNSEIPTKN